MQKNPVSHCYANCEIATEMKTPDILPPAGALTNARADAKEFASYTLAEGTHDAYRRAYAAYRERCDQLGVSPLPCPVKGLVSGCPTVPAQGQNVRRAGDDEAAAPWQSAD